VIAALENRVQRVWTAHGGKRFAPEVWDLRRGLEVGNGGFQRGCPRTRPSVDTMRRQTPWWSSKAWRCAQSRVGSRSSRKNAMNERRE
jgi:hypothetical protein